MSPEERNDRYTMALELRKKGYTLQQIAAKLGVTSRERARQILNDAKNHFNLKTIPIYDKRKIVRI